MSEDDRRRALPSVDRLLQHPVLAPSAARWARRALLAVLRDELERARAAVARGETPPAADELAAACAARLDALGAPRPRAVINATGVVVHTNLGRAPLARAALAEAVEAAAQYCDLEYDLARGARGSRQAHVAGALGLLFPGHATLVVNNNAAAVLLVLNTLALGREVIVSRGELVEIGGSFRVPEILERSGARLREVGTTNRTHPRDVETALDERTALILKVWPSNYRVIGFTAEVDVAQLAALGAARGVPVVVDQGCGRLFRDSAGPASEPSVEELLEAGAGLVCFSGDKMLGGPQAGVIVGRPELVRACAQNPLARALRPDKLTLALLAHACRAALAADPAERTPVAAMLGMTGEALREAAEALARRIALVAPGLATRVVAGASRVGGGAAPEEDLPTFLVAVTPPPGQSDDDLLRRLRHGAPPVIARAQGGAVLLDPRTLLPGQDEAVAAALAAASR